MAMELTFLLLNLAKIHISIPLFLNVPKGGAAGPPVYKYSKKITSSLKRFIEEMQIEPFDVTRCFKNLK